MNKERIESKEYMISTAQYSGLPKRNVLERT